MALSMLASLLLLDAIKKYSPDQPRDASGRWGEGDGEKVSPGKAAKQATSAALKARNSMDIVSGKASPEAQKHVADLLRAAATAHEHPKLLSGKSGPAHASEAYNLRAIAAGHDVQSKNPGMSGGEAWAIARNARESKRS